MSLLDKILNGNLFKAAHGRYADNAENRRLHRVGQEYGHAAKEEVPGPGRKPAQQDDEQKNPLAAKLDTLSPTQLSKIVDTADKKIQEFKDKGYEQGVQKLEEISREARKRLMGDEAYEKHEKEKQQAEHEQKEKPTEEKKSPLVEARERNKQADRDAYIAELEYAYDDDLKDELRVLKRRLQNYPKNSKYPEGSKKYQAAIDEFNFQINAITEELQKRGVKVKPDVKKPAEEPKTDKKPESTGNDVKVEARMTFDDMPMSGKVKMAKYLSGARKNKVDSDFKAIKGLDDATVQTLHDGLVKKFNDGFDDMRKADRAEALYKIAKVKNELQKRFNTY